MAKDPDFIDPAVLKKRAAESGGAGAIPGRPQVRRVREQGHRMVERPVSNFSVSESKVSQRGATVSDDRVDVTR